MKYSEMYLETCFETGEKPTKKGYCSFQEWRKRVDALFADGIPRQGLADGIVVDDT
tara:strand:- start:967 stop:1134 length:168 start_codon:yes stop_codon:yes gene_type:complete